MIFRVLFSFIFTVFIRLISGQAKDGYNVTQIHIAQGKTPESMTVSWVTKFLADTTIMFGTSPDSMVNKAIGYYTDYSFDYPDYGVYESGIIHHVTIEGLNASTVYFYQVGDFTAGVTSGVLSFTTMPAVGDKRPFSFGVLGDLGTTIDSQSTINHVLGKSHLGMILHAGDLSYADCNQPVWDQYGVLIEDLSKER
jgi:hypothetical protein